MKEGFDGYERFFGTIYMSMIVLALFCFPWLIASALFFKYGFLWNLELALPYWFVAFWFTGFAARAIIWEERDE